MTLCPFTKTETEKDKLIDGSEYWVTGTSKVWKVAWFVDNCGFGTGSYTVQGGALIGSTVNVKLLYIAVLKSTANFIQNDMWYVAEWAVYAGKVMQLLLSAI